MQLSFACSGPCVPRVAGRPHAGASMPSLLLRPVPCATSRTPRGLLGAPIAASVAVALVETTTVEPAAEAAVGPASDPEALAALAEAQRLVRCGPTPLGRGLVALQQLDRQCIVSVPLQNALVISGELATYDCGVGP